MPIVLALSVAGGGGCTLEPLGCDDGFCEGAYEPSAEVSLLRDDHGVTHVYGATVDDAYYGSGYAQARDQLFQMDQVRRRALGRRAEVLGAGRLDDDVLIRTLGLPRWGREAALVAARDEPALHRHIEAWTAGVNAFIADVEAGRAPLPTGFVELGYTPERWAPEDGYCVGKLILFGNANLIEYELLATVYRDLFPEVYGALPLYAPLTDAFVLPPEERPPAGQEPRRGLPPSASPDPDRSNLADALAALQRQLRPFRPGASNNWAVEGRHVANGRPLIAGDPHQPLTSPVRMWLHHMASDDGAIDTIGWNFVGSPTVQLGHNRHVVWTATSSYPDTMDLVDVVSDGVTVELDGVPWPIAARTEQVGLRGTEGVEVLVEEVPGVGVLLPDGLSPIPIVPPGHRLLLRWTGLRPTSEAVSFMQMDEATSLDTLEDAIARMDIGNFNFVAAAAEGIRYLSPMDVPRRTLGLGDAPYLLVDGARASELWGDGVLDESQLPRSRGGERGWIASANNDPFGFTADGSLLGDAHYFGVFFDPGTRATRVEEELARLVEGGDLTPADMQALQVDVHTHLADILVPLLEAAVGRIDEDDALAPFRDRPELRALADAIRGWDRRMSRDSGPALAFHAFLWLSTRGAVRDDLTLLFDAVAEASGIFTLKWGLQTLTGAYEGADALLQEGRDVIIVQALADTVAFLEERFGTSDPSGYRWGDVHVTRFASIAGEALDGGAVVTDGADGTVNVSAGVFLDEGGIVDRVESGDGPIYRMVSGFDADGVPRTTFAFARGLSDDPASPWWDHLQGDWAAGAYRDLHYRRDDVEAHVVDTQVLSAGP